MNLPFYRETIKHHGLGSLAYHAAFRAANHLTEVIVLNAIVITPDVVSAEFRADPTRPPGRLVDAVDMECYASDPANMLTREFVAEAETRRDRCYLILEGDVPASYGWYSTQPTRLTELPGAPVLHFDPVYAYMHNGFTRPEFRGRRLHAIGMAAALRELSSRGIKGLVSYVVASNFDSLKSCERMGYRTFGRVAMAKLGNERVWRATPGCKQFGFHIDSALGGV